MPGQKTVEEHEAWRHLLSGCRHPPPSLIQWDPSPTYSEDRDRPESAKPVVASLVRAAGKQADGTTRPVRVRPTLQPSTWGLGYTALLQEGARTENVVSITTSNALDKQPFGFKKEKDLEFWLSQQYGQLINRCASTWNNSKGPAANPILWCQQELKYRHWSGELRQAFLDLSVRRNDKPLSFVELKHGLRLPHRSFDILDSLARCESAIWVKIDAQTAVHVADGLVTPTKPHAPCEPTDADETVQPYAAGYLRECPGNAIHPPAVAIVALTPQQASALTLLSKGPAYSWVTSLQHGSISNGDRFVATFLEWDKVPDVSLRSGDHQACFYFGQSSGVNGNGLPIRTQPHWPPLDSYDACPPLHTPALPRPPHPKSSSRSRQPAATTHDLPASPLPPQPKFSSRSRRQAVHTHNLEDTPMAKFTRGEGVAVVGRLFESLDVREDAEQGATSSSALHQSPAHVPASPLGLLAGNAFLNNTEQGRQCGWPQSTNKVLSTPRVGPLNPASRLRAAEATAHTPTRPSRHT
ncbi:unnamed protein product [Cutaneotrichosporon oleaginosum]